MVRRGFTTLACVTTAALLVLPGTDARADAPTVAIFSLDAKTGVPADTAQLITDHLVEEIRSTGAFSRVVSGRDIEALMSFERQRQMLNCDDSSCIAELAGALGVDFLLTGSLGKLGQSAVFTARLLSMKTGATASSLSMTVCGDAEHLLRSARPAAWHLVTKAGLVRKAPELPPLASECEQAGPNPTVLGLRGAGGALLAGAGVSGVVMLGGALAGILWFVGITNSPEFVGSIPTGGLEKTPRYIAIISPAVLGGVLAGIAVVAGLALSAAGVGALAGSMAVAE